MNPSKAPRVFVSHASEDKERFVTSFAEKLRAHGIDAGLDKWEMFPGDSLVDKIFEEGLKDANAVIVVVSSISIRKPWVREEMNAAFVKRVNQASKLIPVIIDDCEVPECLQSTVWQRISNLESYEAELQRIIMAVLGQTDKPALGTAPRYTTVDVLPVGGLTRLDAVVFSECCRVVLGREHNVIDRNDLQRIADAFQIPQQELEDSVEILAEQHYVKIHPVLGCRIHRIEIPPHGLQRFLETTHPNFAALLQRIALRIMNENLRSGAELFDGIDEPVMVFKTVIHVLESRGFIKTTWYIGGPLAFQIMDVSAKLRRALQS